MLFVIGLITTNIPVRDNKETILEAAIYLEEELSWTASSKLLCGCITNDNPLTVLLEYKHRNDGVKGVQAFRPWRTMTWMIEENVEDDCGVDSHVFYDGRSHHIVKTMRRAWNAYFRYAKGFDTLKPLSSEGINDMGTLSTTAVDALDTLLLLNLQEEFDEASSIVKQNIYKETVNVFETTIRVLGGLLSAYSLSEENWILQHAVKLGEKLLAAFSESIVPASDINLETLQTSNPSWGRSLSEVALTIEFKQLAKITNDRRFDIAVENSDSLLRRQVVLLNSSLLPPTFHFDRENIVWKGYIRLGGRADSYFEYLLKEYVRSKDVRYANSFINAAQEMRRLYISNDNYIFVGEEDKPQMDHLVCFWPGTLALAVKENVLPADPYIEEAQRIMMACLKMHVSPHDLAPEITTLHKNEFVIQQNDKHNLLRPETLESLYMMWSQTQDLMYCEWSWRIFHDMEKASRVEHGYASIEDITSATLRHKNHMPSYFLAETIKYAWLCSEQIIKDEYIFNTEGHFITRQALSNLTINK